jgi:hypothetical protein
MIKAGYKGSGLNDVVWVGPVVNEASKLAGYGENAYLDRRTMVSDVFRNNLNDHNKSLLEWNSNRRAYHGYVVNVAMNDWLTEQ